MQKSVYLAQINYLHGNSTFLPYAVGTLIANAKKYDEIDGFYSFKEPVFIREPVNKVIDRIDDEPFLFGFSNYIWNHEYNKVLARRIKEKYPDCFIFFGGHQISTDASLMEKEEYIDCLCFGEGEEVFAELLLALKNNTSLQDVPNIAYRENGKVLLSKAKKIEKIDYPSPYLTGVFDSIIEHYPEIDFHTIIETNRGCPYNCAYCDWGNLNSHIRFFPEEKVMQELRWLSDHNIRGFGCADANFGMFERDERFVDEMVRLHNEEGVLSRFQVSGAKNSNDRVFRISKKLNECGMDKGATLSFQSLSEEVLCNIQRKNIPVESFSSLLNMYNEAGIATYSELILGLPGETYESFVEGVDILLNAGQHGSIYIHNCEWLPFSTMGNPEYMKKHGVEYVRIPLSEPHTIIDSDDEIEEYSRLVVKTNTMSHSDWIKMNLYAATVQCFHHDGLLIHFALYLKNEKGIEYSRFYSRLMEFMSSNPQTVCGRVFSQLKSRFEDVVEGKCSTVWVDRRFGDVGWLPEEFAFLNIAYEFEKFYDEIEKFLRDFFDDDVVFENLLRYQKNVVKLPMSETVEFDSLYNFKEYFSDILCGNRTSVKKIRCRYLIRNTVNYDNWKDYARYVLWYSRKDSRNIYLEEIETKYFSED